MYNDGKKQKILSKLTGICISYFNERRKVYLPNHNKVANFDCRIYQAPTLHDACVQLLWRENDATKNSVFMLANSMFSHKELQGKNGSEMQDMMMTKSGVNWNNLDVKYKRGTYVRLFSKLTKFSDDEIKKLPKNHHAITNPDLEVVRRVIDVIEYPILSKIENLEEVIFHQCTPTFK